MVAFGGLLSALVAVPLLFNPFDGAVEGVKLLVFVLLGLCLWIFSLDSREIIKNKYINRSLIGLIVFGALSVIFSNDLYLSFFGAEDRKFGFVAILSFVLVAVKFPRVGVESLMKWLVVSGVLASTMAFAFAFCLQGGLFEGRLSGTLGNPNFLGQFLTVPIFLAFYLFIKVKNWRYLLCLFVQIAALAWSGNRASMLALIFVIVLYSVIFIKKSRVILLLTGVVAGGLIVLNFARFAEWRTLQTRVEVYSAAVKAIAHYPVFGVGFEHAQYALDLPGSYTLVADRAHQMFLDAALSSGIVYAAALFVFCISVLKILFKNYLPLAFALLAMLISVQFGFMGITNLFVFAVLAGVAINFVKRNYA